MISQAQPALYEEIERLNLEVVPCGFLGNLEIKSSLEDQIKEAQKRDDEVTKIKELVASGEAKCFSINDQGILYFSNRLVVPNSRKIKDLFFWKLMNPLCLSILVLPRCIEISVKDSGGVE